MNRRGEIERLIRGSRDLRTREAAILWVLLSRADNDTGVVPRRFAPSLATLAFEAKVHAATVKRRLAHLESHGWVERERSTGGAGVKTAYRLVPNGSPRRCRCRKTGADSAPVNWRISTGAEQAHSNGENWRRPLRGKEREVVEVTENENQTESFRAAPRTNLEEDRSGTRGLLPSPSPLKFYDVPECAAAGCGQRPRHGLLTCFDHASGEFGYRRAVEETAHTDAGDGG